MKPQNFGTRVDAVFGALDSIAQPSVGGQSHTVPQWSISQQHVFRTGTEEGDSSDAEEDSRAVQHPEGLVNSVLDEQDSNLQTDESGRVLHPSLAFCQALDREQEYDEADAVAGTSLRGYSDPSDTKPSRSTEVLDNNAYERQMRSHSTAAARNSAHAFNMDIDPHNDPQDAEQQGHVSRGYMALGSTKLLQHQAERRAGPGCGRSRVPHHVQHPEKYTCYILDEPLVVGGGDRVSDMQSQAEQVKAAHAASSAALLAQQQAQPQEPREPLPAFGSGIEFRPTKKARQQSNKPSAGAVKAAADAADPSSLDNDDDIAEEQDTQGPQLKAGSTNMGEAVITPKAGNATSTSAQTKTRRRQYRAKPNFG